MWISPIREGVFEAVRDQLRDEQTTRKRGPHIPLDAAGLSVLTRVADEIEKGVVDLDLVSAEVGKRDANNVGVK
jgi:hypothetical protein